MIFSIMKIKIGEKDTEIKNIEAQKERIQKENDDLQEELKAFKEEYDKKVKAIEEMEAKLSGKTFETME